MQQKKGLKRVVSIAIIVSVAVIAAIFGTVAYAAGVSDGEGGWFGFRKGAPHFSGAKPAELTEEQKAEAKAKAQEQLDKMLAEGKITQEQYDEKLAAHENGELHGGFGRFPEGELPELTEEQKAEAKVKAQEQLDKMLAEGKITQEQYDEKLAAIESGEMMKPQLKEKKAR